MLFEHKKPLFIFLNEDKQGEQNMVIISYYMWESNRGSDVGARRAVPLL